MRKGIGKFLFNGNLPSNVLRYEHIVFGLEYISTKKCQSE